MKKVILILFIIINCFFLNAQVPKGINYQAIARDSAGRKLINKDISVKIFILSDSANGKVLYSELHLVKTNFLGLFELTIGNGTAFDSSFSSIDWSSSESKWLAIYLDANGGNDFRQVGSSQLMSVPFALYVDKAGEAPLISRSVDGKEWIIEVDDNGKVWSRCYPQPTASNAGPDQMNLMDTNTVLAANLPIKGKGRWKIISGKGGVIESNINPFSKFRGIGNRTYKLRWVITTDCDSSYDDVTINIAFRCGDEFVDERDNMVYKTVKIGTQCWMKENLKTTKFQNGNPLINEQNNVRWWTIKNYYYSPGAYCDYNNDTNKATIYGRLYNFYAVSDSRKLAPKGWHIPSLTEWNAMLDLYDSNYNSSDYLMETGTLHWLAPNAYANNQSGFTALPGGQRNFQGPYENIGTSAYWWTSSTQVLGNETYGSAFGIEPGFRNVISIADHQTAGYSIRCIKD
jgi:uncharacterized protein (TIGR02145 family)